MELSLWGEANLIGSSHMAIVKFEYFNAPNQSSYIVYKFKKENKQYGTKFNYNIVVT